MAKIYYDPDTDELVPRKRQEHPQKVRKFHVEKGSALYYLLQLVLILVLTAAFLAFEAQLIYEWWMRGDFIILWGILMVVVFILYGTALIVVVDPDYIIY